MIESGYYPMGAEFDSRAPYNQSSDDKLQQRLCRIACCYTLMHDDMVYCTVDACGIVVDAIRDYEAQCPNPVKIFEAFAQVLAIIINHSYVMAPLMRIDREQLVKFCKDMMDSCRGWQCEPDPDFFEQIKMFKR